MESHEFAIFYEELPEELETFEFDIFVWRGEGCPKWIEDKDGECQPTSFPSSYPAFWVMAHRRYKPPSPHYFTHSFTHLAPHTCFPRSFVHGSMISQGKWSIKWRNFAS